MVFVAFVVLVVDIYSQEMLLMLVFANEQFCYSCRVLDKFGQSLRQELHLVIEFRKFGLGLIGKEHGASLKLEMSSGTWCMDRSIVSGLFLFGNIASGN
ncbi:hypothetical protein L1049_004082 [Liquidambar formosana]|uniref:Uncharacterized protein n=1 Tax=Liquidambar formosana TaxID=63359 RepID=A0AAP0RMS4_LIQFO